MVFEERSFNGTSFRPRPEVHVEEGGQLLAIATPWGQRNGAKRVVECIRDYYLGARQDEEVTSPFQFQTCLSPAANNLRVAIMLANDLLYREDNKNEYLTATELFTASLVEREFVWVQIGQPQIFLKRENRPLLSLGGTVDLSWSLSKTTPLDPLPQNVIGLHSTSNFSVHSFKPSAGDQLILIARGEVPSHFYTLKDLSLNSITTALVNDNSQLPFWVGKLDLLNG